MARLTAHPENTDLPKPELNPLLNPILADNMGRWAEVYFTSPPERREEAVLELLQELERERPGGEKKSQENGPAEAYEQLRPVPPPPNFNLESQLQRIYCGSCGQENPAANQFCGMCGSKLDYQPRGEGTRAEVEPTRPQYPEHTAQNDDPADHMSTAEEPTREPSYYSSSDLSLFQSFRGVQPEEKWEYEETGSTPYRFYIAAVLAIVILVLGYMAWKGTQTSQSAHEISPAPPAPVTESAPTPPANNASPESAPAANESAPPTRAKETARTPAPAPVRAAQPHRMEISRTTPAPQPSDGTPTAGDYGNQELAMAQHFLAGGNGQGRDSAEAAKWLWKAMAKHNGEASILLADLYLKGDGVSKNCDQGRVLLDSAARRGVPGAGERLRNIQAFGCH